MRSQSWIGVGMVVALSLAAGSVVESQTKWPTTKSARPATASKSVQIRKPKPTRKRRAGKPVTGTETQADLLRSMADLVTRQAAAIEALGRRLEAAESRLEQLASASAAGIPVVQTAAAEPTATLPEIDDAQAPFRAALSIDWADLIGR